MEKREEDFLFLKRPVNRRKCARFLVCPKRRFNADRRGDDGSIDQSYATRVRPGQAQVTIGDYTATWLKSRRQCALVAIECRDRNRLNHPSPRPYFLTYSALSALAASIEAARLAGMIPATQVATARTTTAAVITRGSALVI